MDDIAPAPGAVGLREMGHQIKQNEDRHESERRAELADERELARIRDAATQHPYLYERDAPADVEWLLDYIGRLHDNAQRFAKGSA